ncbi:MAG: hypothetical protein HKN49_08250 [Gammaproteobacteria bacterium]|nr:hypothetical protein [Gammaproteobacteria bacterium]
MKKFQPRLAHFAIAGLLLALSLPAAAGIFSSPEKRRASLDLQSEQTLERLLGADAKAKRLFDRSFGYATFNMTKGSILITGGGGSGVAVDRMTQERTYMHVGMGGIGLGLGAQTSRLVLLFEDKETFDQFVRNGWHANSSANAVIGRVGANADTTFTNGIAIYQVTDAGLLLQADVSGTRFWQSRRLNRHKAIRTAQEVLPDS